MTQLLGTIACLAGIAWLFYLDREPDAKPSPALWIPTLWLFVSGSRSITEWLALRPVVTLAQQYSESSPIDAVFYACLIAVGLVILNVRWLRVRGFLRQNLPLILFFAYCLLSVLWSDFPFIAFKRWTKSIGDLVMVMIVLTDPRPWQAVQHLLKRIAFVLLPLSVLFIICYPDLGRGYSPGDGAVMYFGVTTFKNLLGVLAMICGLFSLWAAICAIEDRGMENRHRHIIAHSVVFLVASWLIVKADSMTSLACMVLAGAVMVLAGERNVLRLPAGVPLAISVTVLLPLSALFVSTFGGILHAVGRNATLTDRTLIWQAALALHTNPWIGTGFESFWLGNRLQEVWHMSVNGIQEAHNGYLEIYLNLGWIGIVLLGSVIFAGLNRAISELRHDRQEGRLRVALMTAALIFSMTEAGFRMLSLMWIAFLLAASESPEMSNVRETKMIPGLSWMRRVQPKPLRILR